MPTPSTPNIIVFQLPGAWGLPTISPFCLKLSAWLRMTDLPHSVVTVATPFGGPKRKAPWAMIDGLGLGDSDFIIQRLKAVCGVDPDAGLSATERARSRALQHLLEHSLCQAMVHDRWMIDAHWKQFRPIVLSRVPRLFHPVAAPMVRAQVRAQLRAQGMGRHAPNEVLDIARRDLRAVADWLGDQPWFMGDTPTDIDAGAYGLLANIIRAEIDSPLRQAARDLANLPAFVDRFEARYSGRGECRPSCS